MSRLKSFFWKKIGNNFYLFKLYYKLLPYLTNLSDKDPIIIHQMGKVGSSSIYNSLIAQNVGRPLYHVHNLRTVYINKSLKSYPTSDKKYFIRSKHIQISEYLSREINKVGNDTHCWKVITLIREPVAQNISSFFQTLDVLVPNYIQKYQDGQITIDDFLKLFLERYNVATIFHHWFEEEIEPIFNIDIYNDVFPKDVGFKIYQGEKSRLLLIKLEKMRDCISNAINEFIGIYNFELIDNNLSADKVYFNIYNEFKRKAKFPASYINSVYSTKQACHFYTETEIQSFKDQLTIVD